MRRLLPILLLLACNRTNTIVQVLPPGARIDVLPQLQSPQLDVLFVIDNSRFMSVIGPQIAQTFQNFTAYLDKNQMDYHLGVVSATINAGGSVIFYGGGSKQYIASTDGNAASAMGQAIAALGANGSAISPVLEQANLALQEAPTGFLRAGAALFIVVITDNNDQWSPPAVQTAPYDDANLFYYRALKQSKGAGNDGLVRFAAIAGPDIPNVQCGCSIPDPSNPAGGFCAQPAGRLDAFAKEMGGVFESICAPDFSTVFNDLGALGAGLKTVFRLTETPDPKSLVVTVRVPCGADPSTLAACASVDDQCSSASPAKVCTPKSAATDGWTYDASTLSIVFSGAAIPPRGAEVDVQYSVPGQ